MWKRADHDRAEPRALLFAACFGVVVGGCSDSHGKAPGPGGVREPARPFDAAFSVSGSSFGVRLGEEVTSLGEGQLCGMSPDRRAVCLTGPGGKSAAIVDGDGRRTPFAGATAVAWSPDGSRLAFVRDDLPFVADADGRHELAVADEGALTASPILSLVTWSPDGAHVAFELYLDPSSSTPVNTLVADAATGAATAVFETFLSNFTASARFSPDGTRFGIPSSSGLVLMDADGENRVDVEVEGAIDVGDTVGGWSFDGALIALGQNIVSADGADLTDLGMDNGDPEVDRWSPVAPTLAYVDLSGIELWSADGPVSFDQYEPVDLAWSPDGTRLAAQVHDDSDPSAGGWASVVLDPSDGSELARVPSAAPTLGLFSWNADGSRFLASSLDLELFVGDSAGGELTGFSYADQGAWLPDGEHLIIGGDGVVTVALADGSEAETIWSGSEGEHVTAFLP